MGAMEGLRTLRDEGSKNSHLSVSDLSTNLRLIDTVFASLDIDAALELNELVEQVSSPNQFVFYRYCIERMFFHEGATWRHSVTLGRSRFQQQLSTDEIQCFRAARLLDQPPSADSVQWWDRISAKMRGIKDADKLERAREAEALTLQHEGARLKSLGIEREPQWKAVEDNTAGYDVLSYDPGIYEPTNRLIEVKSSVASPLRFYLTRNEWDQALKYGASFHFHIWDMNASPPRLHERTTAQIMPHVPSDNEKGRWSNCVIPLSAQ